MENTAKTGAGGRRRPPFPESCVDVPAPSVRILRRCRSAEAAAGGGRNE